MQDNERYMIQNGFVGNCMYFWAKNDCGYTCHLDEAETYTLEEAKARCRPHNDEKIWPVSAIKAGASTMVDFQKVDYEARIELPKQPSEIIKSSAPKCEGCGRFQTAEQAYCGCDNCGTAP